MIDSAETSCIHALDALEAVLFYQLHIAHHRAVWSFLHCFLERIFQFIDEILSVFGADVILSLVLFVVFFEVCWGEEE